MGVLPLEFTNGDTRNTYNIDGTETYDVIGTTAPGGAMTVVMTRSCSEGKGEVIEIPVKCRLDTAEEVTVYNGGGVLQKFATDFLKSNA
jgi:aconitate hydratase